MRSIFYILFVALAFSACSIHRVDVQQGNIVEPAQLEKLKIGMDRNQVRFVLGSPLVTDPFHDNRWDYVYSRRRETGPHELSRVTVHFENDAVARIESGSTAALKPSAPSPSNP